MARSCWSTACSRSRCVHRRRQAGCRPGGSSWSASLGIAAGIAHLLWPGITAIVLLLFIGGWAIVHGILQIIGAIRLRKEIDNEWTLILGGVLSVLFGVSC